MKVSLSNGVFSSLPLSENLASVRQLGFGGLEFNMKSVEKQADDSPLPAKKLVAACGLKCLTLHAASLNVQREGEVATAIYYGLVSADFAHALSAPIMVVHSNVSRKLPEEQRLRFLAEIFGELNRCAKKLHLRLALENLSYASSGYGKNVAELEEIFSVIDDGTMGFTLDFCHATATGQTSQLLEAFHDRLCNVHLSNRAHKPFTAENQNLNIFLKSLRDYGYGGPLTLELSRKCAHQEILRTKATVEESLSRLP